MQELIHKNDIAAYSGICPLLSFTLPMSCLSAVDKLHLTQKWGEKWLYEAIEELAWAKKKKLKLTTLAQ